MTRGMQARRASRRGDQPATEPTVFEENFVIYDENTDLTTSSRVAPLQVKSGVRMFGGVGGGWCHEVPRGSGDVASRLLGLAFTSEVLGPGVARRGGALSQAHEDAVRSPVPVRGTVDVGPDVVGISLPPVRASGAGYFGTPRRCEPDGLGGEGPAHRVLVARAFPGRPRGRGRRRSSRRDRSSARSGLGTPIGTRRCHRAQGASIPRCNQGVVSGGQECHDNECHDTKRAGQ